MEQKQHIKRSSDESYKGGVSQHFLFDGVLRTIPHSFEASISVPMEKPDNARCERAVQDGDNYIFQTEHALGQSDNNILREDAVQQVK
ncbi:hypothetical protein SYK_19400 [Pseudodesulfovibrio nedwellii]|uniref:Uncharacterized protein n=1 Tax=Pseudodesulfovibrio nedwellii TaxID=2973072 RepID=A0ABM8B189_9BACT|nr:hypothetical protein SYK_19400 [Pseudodesulfovibrio nedwellii]